MLTSDVDAVALTKPDDFVVVKVGMRLDLVDGRLDDGFRQEALELLDAEVGHADGFDDAA